MLRTLFFAIFLLWFVTPSFANEAVELTNIGELKRAYFLQDTDSERVSVNLIIHVGEYDLSGVEGLAHYLEHLVFTSADRVHENGSIKQRQTNAFTSGTYTNYVNSGKPDQLEKMLENMVNVFEKPELSSEFALSEIDIVRREYELRMSDNPRAKIFSNLAKKLYGENGFGRSVIGSPSDFDNFTPQLAYEIHEKYYMPSNASLFISGNISPRKVKKLVAKYFKNLEGGQLNVEIIKALPSTPILRSIDEITEEKFNEARLIYIKEFSLPKGKTYQEIEVFFDLLHEILNSSLDGSLAKPLRYDEYIVAGYSLYLEQTTNGRAMLSLSARPDSGIDIKIVLEKFEQILSDIGVNGIPKETFERIRKREIADIEENIEEVGFASSLVMNSLLDDQNVISPKQYLAIFKKIKLKDLNELVNLIAAQNHVAAALAYPKERE